MSGKLSHNTWLALELVKSGKMNPHQAANHIGIAVPTIYRALKRQREEAKAKLESKPV